MTLTMSTIILTGDISRRIKKYATEDETYQAKLMSYKKCGAHYIIEIMFNCHMN